MNKLQQHLLVIPNQAAKVQEDGMAKRVGQAAQLILKAVEPF
ncbi:hypothetical protein B4109_0435 [Geobacillus stearothermophilus]|uniref:Uncharacterized protein n=1 Tax=Geobacillus stearothermophilus TaxID=1422 RepID=A0A150MKN3_GEOSE|nr:hypothetical protein B4109_0435 [Geobacillus stearothermophilus]